MYNLTYLQGYDLPFYSYSQKCVLFPWYHRKTYQWLPWKWHIWYGVHNNSFSEILLIFGLFWCSNPFPLPPPPKKHTQTHLFSCYWFLVYVGYVGLEYIRVFFTNIIDVAISSQVCPFHPRLTGLVATHWVHLVIILIVVQESESVTFFVSEQNSWSERTWEEQGH